MTKQRHPRRRPEEVRDVWLATAILLVAVFYRLAVHLEDQVQELFDAVTRLPYAQWITELLFLWLLVLLWVAYSRWRRAMVRTRELDTILTSIGPDVLIVIDAHRNITLCNGAIDAMYGYSEKDVIGVKTDLLYFDRRLDKGGNEIREDLRRKGFHIGRAKGKRKDGREFPLEVITATLQATPGAVLLLRDITDRVQLEERLRELSSHDELTGLHNRRGFFEAAKQQLEFAKRYQLKMFLLYLDLNKFKRINDTQGHHVGDDALKATSEVLKTHLRAADIIGRLGGDEFAVLGAATEANTAQTMMERLHAAFAAYQDPEQRFQLSVSIGSSLFDPASSRTLEDLTTEADARMYEQKTGQAST